MTSAHERGKAPGGPKFAHFGCARSRKNTTHEVKTATPRAPLRMSPVASCDGAMANASAFFTQILASTFFARSLRTFFFVTRNFTRILHIHFARSLLRSATALLPRLFFFLRALV